jgi:UrcA family protein
MVRKNTFRKSIAAVACVLISGVGWAAQNDEDRMPQITVQARQKVSTKQVGVSYTGIPIEEIQLTRHVGYGDLDLSSSQGRAALDKRIRETAKKACEQLNSLYPLEQWIGDDGACLNRALDAAMEQEKTIVAAASQK